MRPPNQLTESGAAHGRRHWRITPRFWLVALCCLGLYVTVSYVQGFLRIAHIREQIRQVEREIDAVQARNEALQAEVARLGSDAYVEERAREDLGLVMPGETAVIVVEEKADDS